jgi:adenylate cyclase
VSFRLANYRAYAEAHGAAAGAALIDRFNRFLTDVVFAYEGTLVPGDSQQVIAMFNAPLQQPDHAYRAVRAARDAHQRIHTQHPDLALAAGIYTGRAMVGSRGRGLYTALGEPVDLAVQIARGGQPGQTLLGLPTYEEVEDLIDAELAPLISIEGQASPVVVYAVQG